jgi:sugar phosphate isomerase/epimerase
VDVALAPLTVGRPEPHVLVEAAAAAGFRRVGLTLWPPDGDLSPLCTDDGARRKLREAMSAAGVGTLDVGVVDLSPDLELDDACRLVHAAADLGADRLLVKNSEDDARHAADLLSAMGAYATEADLLVAVEFMPYTATQTLDQAMELVTTSAVPKAGVALDVLHLFRSGGSVGDLARFDVRRIHLVQLCDAPLEAPDFGLLRDEALTDRRYPGDGELPLGELLAALPGDVAMTVEAPVAADADRSPEERAKAAAAAVGRLFGGR